MLHIFSANMLWLSDVDCLFSSRLDSSRENQLKTWRKIWRTLIEDCGSVASIPQVNTYDTSSQGHWDHIAGPSLGTFRNMKIRVWVHQKRTQHFAWHFDSSSCVHCKIRLNVNSSEPLRRHMIGGDFAKPREASFEQQSIKGSSIAWTQHPTSHGPSSVTPLRHSSSA